MATYDRLQTSKDRDSETREISDIHIVPSSYGSTGSPPMKNAHAEATLDEKRTVYVQVVFIKLGDIDTIKESFVADVFIQARWREPSLDNPRTGIIKNPDAIDFDDYWNPKLSIDNVLGDVKETVGHTVIYDVTNWEAYIVERRRAKGTFFESLELFQFPFDTQELNIKIVSEVSADKLSMEKDPLNLSTINVESFTDEQEWHLYKVVESDSGVENKMYQGDTIKNSSHPYFKCTTHAERRTGFYVFSIFAVMCIICSLIFCSFAVDCEKRESRISMTFTLLLVTVTFKFAVNSTLPRISYLTNMDIYIFMTMSSLLIVCIWHAVVNEITDKTYRQISDKVFLIIMGSIHAMGQISYILIIGIRASIRTKTYKEKERQHQSYLACENMDISGAKENLKDIRLVVKPPKG